MNWKTVAAAVLVVAAIAPAHAAEDRATTILHSISENAAMARHNAEIRQWRRLNYEADRIVADFNRLERMAAGDAQLSAKVAQLGDAVKALDAARTRRDSKAGIEAATRLGSIAK